MRNITLIMDTSDNTQTKVGLKINGKKVLLQEKKNKASQNLLPMIVKLLRQEKLTLKDLTAIEINPGPGSYTGLKVGAAVANILSYILSIPVNGKKSLVPKYS